MNVINFTPQSAFVGGIIIGLAVILFFVGNGRLAGVSGIVNNAFASKQSRLETCRIAARSDQDNKYMKEDNNACSSAFTFIHTTKRNHAPSA